MKLKRQRPLDSGSLVRVCSFLKCQTTTVLVLPSIILHNSKRVIDRMEKLRTSRPWQTRSYDRCDNAGSTNVFGAECARSSPIRTNEELINTELNLSAAGYAKIRFYDGSFNIGFYHRVMQLFADRRRKCCIACTCRKIRKNAAPRKVNWISRGACIKIIPGGTLKHKNN